MVQECTVRVKWEYAPLLSWFAVGLVMSAALLAMLAGFGSRFGWWQFRTGFALLGYAAYGALAASLIACAGLFMCLRKRQLMGSVLAMLALIAGLTVAAVPANWRLSAKSLPYIHDISTDTVNPPQFVAILPLRASSPNPATYGGPEVAAEQKRGYGDLRTEVLDLPLGQAYERALATARALGWKIIAADAAQGRIEATDTTFWFGFTDDIVIRLAPAGARTLLDIRSVSRVGKSDVGTNARRIRAFLKKVRG
jgi:hypothetical protein